MGGVTQHHVAGIHQSSLRPHFAARLQTTVKRERPLGPRPPRLGLGPRETAAGVRAPRAGAGRSGRVTARLTYSWR